MAETVLSFPSPNPFAEAFGSIGQGGMDIAQTLLLREAIERQRKQFSFGEQKSQLEMKMLKEQVDAIGRRSKIGQKIGQALQGAFSGSQPGAPQATNPFINTNQDREAMRLLELLPELGEADPEEVMKIFGQFAQQRLKPSIGQQLEQLRPFMQEGTGSGLPAGVEIDLGGVKVTGGASTEGRRKRVEFVTEQGYDTQDPRVRSYVNTGDFSALPPGASPKAVQSASSGQALADMREAITDFQKFQTKVARGEVKPSITDMRLMLATMAKSRDAIELAGAGIDEESKTVALQNIDLAISSLSRDIASATAGKEQVEGRRALLDQAKEAVKTYGSREAAEAAVTKQAPEHQEIFRRAIDFVYPRGRR